MELKGTNKEIWRNYCEFFKETVDEYNLGTILRIRADGAYSEENSIIVPKVKFFKKVICDILRVVFLFFFKKGDENSIRFKIHQNVVFSMTSTIILLLNIFSIV